MSKRKPAEDWATQKAKGWMDRVRGKPPKGMKHVTPDVRTLAALLREVALEHYKIGSWDEYAARKAMDSR